MSVKTKLALDEALAAHVASESHGGILNGYVCQVEFTSVELMDGHASGYLRLTGERQGFTTSLGLALYTMKQLKEEIMDSVDLEDE